MQRCGRTGRAGRYIIRSLFPRSSFTFLKKNRFGTAYTFVMRDEAQFAPDVVRALKDSQAPIPPDLIALAEGFVIF